MLQNNLRKITGFQKKLNVEVGICIKNSVILAPNLGAEKCISLFMIREMYYLRIQGRYNRITLVLKILFALCISFVCAYFIIKTNRIIWTSHVGAGGQRLNAGSSWGRSGCAQTESAASQTWPKTQDWFKFIPDPDPGPTDSDPYLKPLKHGRKQMIDLNSFRGSASRGLPIRIRIYSILT